MGLGNLSVLGRSDDKLSIASLLFFQVLSTLRSSGLHVVDKLTLLTVKAGVLLHEQRIGPKMGGEGGKKKPHLQSRRHKAKRMCIMQVSLSSHSLGPM